MNFDMPNSWTSVPAVLIGLIVVICALIYRAFRTATAGFGRGCPATRRNAGARAGSPAE